MRILFLLSIALHFSVVSQKSYKVTYAQNLSDRLDFSASYPVWVEISDEIIAKKSTDLGSIRRTIEAAEMTERYDRALHYSNYLIQSTGLLASDWVKHFKLLSLNNRHSELTSWIDSAQVLFPDDIQIQQWKTNLPLIEKSMSLTSEYTLRLFPTNSKGEEYGAFPYKNGIVYVSNDNNTKSIARDYSRIAQPFTDICFYDSTELNDKLRIWNGKYWQKKRFKNQWTEISNSASHEGPISFNPEYKMAFVTKNQTETDKIARIKFNRLQLVVYRKVGNSWREIDFPFNGVDFSTGHGTMDDKGWLIFASTRPGGFGGSDLYRTRLKGKKWSDPENLGEFINTSGDELFPYISDNGTLYFSSNGWPGIGGLDIFQSTLNGVQPEAIGAPINTFADDFSFYVNESKGTGYVSSNRDDWKDQIYALQKPVYDVKVLFALKNCKGKLQANKPITVIDLTTSDSTEYTTNKDGKVEVSNLIKGREYAFKFFGDKALGEASQTFSAKKQGEFDMELTAEFAQKIHTIIATSEDGKPLEGVFFTLYGKNGKKQNSISKKDGAFSFIHTKKEMVDSVAIQFINHKDVVFKVPNKDNGNCIDTLKFPIKLKKNEAKEFIRLDMILYSFNKSELRPESKKELDKLVKYMLQRPELRIELSSHTDSRGSDEYNIELSNSRSQSCVNYIISKGISPLMIIAKGYGETQLLNKCKDGVICTDEEHQANRRTELRFLTVNESGASNPLQMNKLEVAKKEPTPVVEVQTPIETVKPVKPVKIAPPALNTPINNNVSKSTGKLEAGQGLFFTIQVGVYSSSAANNELKGLSPLVKFPLPNGQTRYSVGKFSSLESAQMKKVELEQKGFKSTFITAYYKGERITISEAQKLIESNGSSILETN